MYILGIVLMLLIWALIWDTNYSDIKDLVKDNEDIFMFALIIALSSAIWVLALPMAIIFVLLKETR